jgi:simple sugar transport system permease protein
VIGTMFGAVTFGVIQVGLVLAGAPDHFFRTLTGFIVVAAVILNTSVARRMARSRPLAGVRRGNAETDAALSRDLDSATAEAEVEEPPGFSAEGAPGNGR